MLGLILFNSTITFGIGRFHRKCRSFLSETGWLGAGFISVCLETRWLGKRGFYVPEPYILNKDKVKGSAGRVCVRKQWTQEEEEEEEEEEEFT